MAHFATPRNLAQGIVASAPVVVSVDVNPRIINTLNLINVHASTTLLAQVYALPAGVSVPAPQFLLFQANIAAGATVTRANGGPLVLESNAQLVIASSVDASLVYSVHGAMLEDI